MSLRVTRVQIPHSPLVIILKSSGIQICPSCRFFFLFIPPSNSHPALKTAISIFISFLPIPSKSSKAGKMSPISVALSLFTLVIIGGLLSMTAGVLTMLRILLSGLTLPATGLITPFSSQRVSLLMAVKSTRPLSLLSKRRLYKISFNLLHLPHSL